MAKQDNAPKAGDDLEHVEVEDGVFGGAPIRFEAVNAEQRKKVAPAPGEDVTIPPEEPSEPAPITLTVPEEYKDAAALVIESLVRSGTTDPIAVQDAIRRFTAAADAQAERDRQNKATLSEHEAYLKQLGVQPSMMVSPEFARAEMRKQQKLTAQTLNMDVGVPGGRFLAADGKTYINANGERIS